MILICLFRDDFDFKSLETHWLWFDLQISFWHDLCDFDLNKKFSDHSQNWVSRVISSSFIPDTGLESFLPLVYTYSITLWTSVCSVSPDLLHSLLQLSRIAYYLYMFSCRKLTGLRTRMLGSHNSSEISPVFPDARIQHCWVGTEGAILQWCYHCDVNCTNHLRLFRHNQ